MKIPEARFVGNPHPLKVKNALCKVFRQFRVLAHTMGGSIFNWNGSARSRERSLSGYKSLEILANVVKCFSPGVSLPDIAGQFTTSAIHGINFRRDAFTGPVGC
jgi:hypothetical protein